MSCKRIMPRQTTTLPGGGSCLRARQPEQIELICRGLARHGPPPDSRREDPMLRPNPPIAMGWGNWPSRPAAVSPRRQAFWDQHVGQRQCATWRRPRDQTSRPEPPAIDRGRAQRDCSGKPPGQPSRSPHEREHNARPRDAMDKETRVPRSRGRSLVVLFNIARPHSSLGYQTPAASPEPSPQPAPTLPRQPRGCPAPGAKPNGRDRLSLPKKSGLGSRAPGERHQARAPR